MTVIRPGNEPSRHAVDLLNDKVIRLQSALKNRARPIFVEFAGMPRAGKSSCIRTTAEFLENKGIQVYRPPEGASQAPPHLKKVNLVAYNLWTGTYAVARILENTHLGPPPREFVFLDRGLFDAECWFRWLERKGEVTLRDRKVIAEFLRLEHHRAFVDVVFVFQCSPRVAKRREESGRLEPRGAKVTMNLKSLEELRAGYQYAASCGDRYTSVVTVDTTASPSPKATAFTLTGIIVDKALKMAGVN